MVALLTLAVPPPPAEAATQFVVWPAEFSYNTPGGAFTWRTTAFGVRFDRSFAPLLSMRTSLFYGPISNLSFNGAPLSGYNAQTLAGDVSFRVGAGAGVVSIAGYAGYGGYALNASGPGASDRIILSTLGVRLGAEASMVFSPITSLRANYVQVISQNSDANAAWTAPAIAIQDSGRGG